MIEAEGIRQGLKGRPLKRFVKRKIYRIIKKSVRAIDASNESK